LPLIGAHVAAPDLVTSVGVTGTAPLGRAAALADDACTTATEPRAKLRRAIEERCRFMTRH
jgi:hypothetical protein